MNQFIFCKKNILFFLFTLSLLGFSNSVLGQEEEDGIIKLKKEIAGGNDERCIHVGDLDGFFIIENESKKKKVTITKIVITTDPSVNSSVTSYNGDPEFGPFKLSTASTMTYNYSINFNFGVTPNFIPDYLTVIVDLSYTTEDGVSGMVSIKLKYKMCNGGSSPTNEGDIKSRLSNETNDSNIQISPNPTTDKFNIQYSLEEASNVSIVLYNSLGQKIKTIVQEDQQSKGNYNVEDFLSSELETGIYYIMYQIGEQIKTEKLLKI